MFLLSALHIKKKKSRPVRICVSCSGLKKPWQGSCWTFFRLAERTCVGLLFSFFENCFIRFKSEDFRIWRERESSPNSAAWNWYLLEPCKSPICFMHFLAPAESLGLTSWPQTCAQLPQGGQTRIWLWAFISTIHLAHSRYPPPPAPPPFSRKWHKPLFGLPRCTVPPLFLIPGD